MPTAWKFKSLLFVVCLITAGMPTRGGARPFGHDQKEQTAKADADSQEETAEEDLAPAALQFDVSNVSPLIRELYQATRESKEQPILESLARAKKLLEDGSDVKATDAQGRTALHWGVFGSSYSKKGKILVAYEEIADGLIGRGVDINDEDVYQDTALDYLVYSPQL